MPTPEETAGITIGASLVVATLLPTCDSTEKMTIAIRTGVDISLAIFGAIQAATATTSPPPPLVPPKIIPARPATEGDPPPFISNPEDEGDQQLERNPNPHAH